jgi:hypothetical protein
MGPLTRELRKRLDDAVVKARDVAEFAARSALASLGVEAESAHPNLGQEERRLRVALRAKVRQLGSTEALVSEIAYQHWHRMLFARFLAENDLLMHPTGVAVTLEEVAELAKDEAEPDPWALAARYAANMLPAIFREGDPELRIRLAPEGRQGLETVLASLPVEVFTSDDGLGWVYQFWQTKRKKEVNASGGKIGAAELPAVTQLFTEEYLVRFLLENTLGAWWASRHPDSLLVKSFDYLRLSEDGIPVSGTFRSWPNHASEITVMDPCCGSGHFLTAAFEMLTSMRMEEEGLDEKEAGDAVIAGNLFGLELDLRCTQIAAFALALSAWKRGGYRVLPRPNLACSGIGVKGQLEEWRKLARGDERLEMALEALHEQFRSAPDLGSLIDPRNATQEGNLFSVDYREVAPLLEKGLKGEDDPGSWTAGWTAAGTAHAALLLARTYTLVVTNVPYLKRSKQGQALRDFLANRYPVASADLATSFFERCRDMVDQDGVCALVTPHNWKVLGTYQGMRVNSLNKDSWLLSINLGPKAFQTGMWDFNVGLSVLSHATPRTDHEMYCLDLSRLNTPVAKAHGLRIEELSALSQRDQLNNPDARILSSDIAHGALLREVAESLGGIQMGDNARFGRMFWELPLPRSGWIFHQNTVSTTIAYGGREEVIRWDDGKGALANSPTAFIRGTKAWKKRGVFVSRMGALPSTLYTGESFDQNGAVLLPNNIDYLPAIWAFTRSPDFAASVRAIDPSLKVTNATLAKVPFDIERWQKEADEAGPLPEPHSDDPTQWLFRGSPRGSTKPLQVAVARLVGYRWPQQEPDDLDEFADADGMVCIPAVGGEQPGTERLRGLLGRAFGESWSNELVSELLAKAGAQGKSLEEWLRDSFFPAHCKLFRNRPFVWQIWDGRRDGFSALLNYHRLDRAALSRLIHTLLGSWIKLQRDQAAAGISGSEARLVAAEALKARLELILEGEPPYDIYVRWKPLQDQPIGWNPDIDVGVRLNIRPFVQAGVLRSKFSINWKKDRGRNSDGSERLNELHFTRAEREAERAKTGES